jgi:hypothetical protein
MIFGRMTFSIMTSGANVIKTAAIAFSSVKIYGIGVLITLNTLILRYKKGNLLPFHGNCRGNIVL